MGRPSRRRADKAGLVTRPIELVPPETTPGNGTEALDVPRGDRAETAPDVTSTSGAATFWSGEVDSHASGPLPDRRRPVPHRASPLDYLPKLSLMPFVVALNFAVFIWLIWTVIS